MREAYEIRISRVDFLEFSITYLIIFIVCCWLIWMIPYPGSPWLFYEFGIFL